MEPLSPFLSVTIIIMAVGSVFSLIHQLDSSKEKKKQKKAIDDMIDMLRAFNKEPSENSGHEEDPSIAYVKAQIMMSGLLFDRWMVNFTEEEKKDFYYQFNKDK